MLSVTSSYDFKFDSLDPLKTLCQFFEYFSFDFLKSQKTPLWLVSYHHIFAVIASLTMGASNYNVSDLLRCNENQIFRKELLPQKFSVD